MKPKISVAILTFNEEKNIRDCLESVKWADEIILVDEESSDNTLKIAREFTKHITLVDHSSGALKPKEKNEKSWGHETMFHKNKQLAVEKCTGEWIFQIDADERVTEELKKEIINTVQTPEYSGYEVPRKSLIFGKWIEHTGWYPDYQVKLFKNGLGHYPCQTVHEQIKVDGRIGRLVGPLLHYHYQNVEEFADRLNRYTTNDAIFLLTSGQKVEWSDALKFPLDEFVKRFFLWEGYKDGLHGLVLSLMQSFGRLIVFAKMWESAGFYEKKISNQELQSQSNFISKTIKYWYLTSIIKSSPDFASRFRARVGRKMIKPHG